MAYNAALLCTMGDKIVQLVLTAICKVHALKVLFLCQCHVTPVYAICRKKKPLIWS